MTQARTSTIPNPAALAAKERKFGQDEPAHTEQPRESPHASRAPPLVPLELEVRAALPTAEAAAHLNRAPQTLRLWAMRQDGPIQPLRINGRLAWPTAQIRRLLEVG